MDKTIESLAREVKQMNKSAYRLGYYSKKVKKYYNDKVCEYKESKDFDALNCCRKDIRKLYNNKNEVKIK